MEQIANQVIFGLLALVIVVCSILTVTTRRILRAATYLLFVLFAVQLAVYAGGIVVLFVFSILLTSHPGDKSEVLTPKKRVVGLIASIFGAIVCGYTLFTYPFFTKPLTSVITGEVDMKEIGHALMGMDKFQYLLPFEAVSVLFLACIIGGIMIARKRLETMELPMIAYLVVSTIMLIAGDYGFVTRKNMLSMRISLELMLNAVDINFVVFNRYLYPEALEGFFFTLFAIGIAAAETALAIAIIINIFRHIRNVEVRNLDKMKY